MQRWGLLTTMLLFSMNSLAQCENVVEQCLAKLDLDPLSKGGSVKQLLLLNESIRLPIALSADTAYRVALCSHSEDNPMLYRILDADNKTLASFDAPEQELETAQVDAEAYTQFLSPSQSQGVIVAELQQATKEPMCAALAIGFEPAI